MSRLGVQGGMHELMITLTVQDPIGVNVVVISRVRASVTVQAAARFMWSEIGLGVQTGF